MIRWPRDKQRAEQRADERARNGEAEGIISEVERVPQRVGRSRNDRRVEAKQKRSQRGDGDAGEENRAAAFGSLRG